MRMLTRTRRALIRMGGSASLLWSDRTDAWGNAPHSPGVGCGCLCLWESRGAAVGTGGLGRAAPARPISRRACGHVCPVSHTARCARSTRPHTVVPGRSHPHSYAIPHATVGVYSPQNCRPTWVDG